MRNTIIRYLWASVIVLLFIVGIGLLLYPTASNYLNAKRQARAIATNVDKVKALDADIYEQMLADAEEYNRKLFEEQIGFILSEEEMEEYNSLLCISDTGIMGYIEIPQLNCSLPIYHGTSEDVLQVAIGHIPGSSLPVGGKNTHCVLSGHSGLPSAKLFTDLDKLEIGDRFQIYVMDRELTYEVSQIQIVLPDQVSSLEIEAGKDLCTLVTCTPYGINTHRLLVQGHRVENTDEEKK